MGKPEHARIQNKLQYYITSNRHIADVTVTPVTDVRSFLVFGINIAIYFVYYYASHTVVLSLFLCTTNTNNKDKMYSTIIFFPKLALHGFASNNKLGDLVHTTFNIFSQVATLNSKPKKFAQDVIVTK